MKKNMGGLLKSNANMRNLWLGESISNFGNFFYDVAITWLVFQKTGSAAQSGLMLVAAFLPQVLIGPFLGAIADRMPKKRLMLCASIGQGILTGILAVLIPLHQVRLWEIYVVTALLAVGQLVYSPARSGMFPDIVAKDDLFTANSLFTSSQQAIRIVGSVAGGTVVAFMGPTASIGCNTVSFFVSAWFILNIHHVDSGTRSSSGTKPTLLQDVKQGWAWLTGQPVMLMLIFLGTVSNVALGPTNVLPPMFIQQSLHGNALSLGAFDASIGLGILIGGLILGSMSPNRIGMLFTLGLGLQGLSMAVVSLAPSVGAACVGNFILGFAVIVASLPMSTMFQVIIPGHVRGRVNSISSALFTISIPITYGGIGFLGDKIGARWCYGLGTCLLLFCLILGLSMAKLRQLTTARDCEPASREHTASFDQQYEPTV